MCVNTIDKEIVGFGEDQIGFVIKKFNFPLELYAENESIDD